MTPGKDEAVLTRVLNRVTGEDALLLIHPNDMAEEEAMSKLNQGFDLDLYQRESTKRMSHWLDRLGGNPGHTYVVFKKATRS